MYTIVDTFSHCMYRSTERLNQVQSTGLLAQDVHNVFVPSRAPAHLNSIAFRPSVHRDTLLEPPKKMIALRLLTGGAIFLPDVTLSKRAHRPRLLAPLAVANRHEHACAIVATAHTGLNTF